MFSQWQCLSLSAVIRRPPISRFADSRDGLVSLLALRKDFKFHVSIQQRCRSSKIRRVRQEGFWTRRGVFVKCGDTVELDDGTFLRVKQVLHNESKNEHEIVGWKFVRNRETCGLPKENLNEVYWVVHLVKDSPQLADKQALVRADRSVVLRKRQMNMVNTAYPARQRGSGTGDLFCRWKHVVMTRTRKIDRPLDAFTIHAREIIEAGFYRLRPEECDEGIGNYIADETLRQSWRRVEREVDKDSQNPTSLESAVEALSIDGNSRHESAPPVYTFADVCCGAGGASRGAEMADLRVRWALDHDDTACKTYHLNFPEVRLFRSQIKDVVYMRQEDSQVDIMHFSPPCQPFSLANTTPNLDNDLLNIAASMALADCIETVRPRIATLEQTSGLMSRGYVGGAHNIHWSNIIRQFTSVGFSVAWKIINLAELGVIQPRKRLIIIAAW